MATKKETKPKTSKAKKVKELEVEEVIIDGGDANETEKKPKKKATKKPVKKIEKEEVKEIQEVKEVKSLGNFKDSKDGAQVQEEVKLTPEEVQTAMSWREYKDGESNQEMGDRLQKEANEHKEALERTTDLDELDKMEKEILATLDEFDKYIKQKRYRLPNSVVFDGAAYSKSQIGDRIARALNKKEVTWQYSLGLYQLHKLWSNIRQFATIPYDAYDSTVRILGDITFKGLTEWRDILIINEFFVAPNKEFYKDSTMLIYYSTIHSQILERKQMLSPVKSDDK